MTAKEYLRQLQLYDLKVNHKIKEVEALREMSKSVGSATGEGERVQTSSAGVPKQISMIEKCMDLENEINDIIDKYIDAKDRIINQIHQLDDVRYVELLFLRYVPDERGKVKRLEEISCIMKKSNGEEYTYQRILELHGAALKAFETKILKKVKNTM